jgi:hypothetical protein
MLGVVMEDLEFVEEHDDPEVLAMIGGDLRDGLARPWDGREHEPRASRIGRCFPWSTPTIEYFGPYTFDHEFFDIAVREPVAEIPTASQHDDLGREPVTSER